MRVRQLLGRGLLQERLEALTVRQGLIHVGTGIAGGRSYAVDGHSPWWQSRHSDVEWHVALRAVSSCDCCDRQKVRACRQPAQRQSQPIVRLTHG